MSAFDTFGKWLMGYYLGDRTPVRIHRDDGYVDEASFDQYFAGYSDWPEYEKKALRYVRGKVLDIGCGAGRHSLWLQERGVEVVGIDVSRLAAEVAKLREVENCMVMSGLNMHFRPESFDTVLLLGNNFGIAGNKQATKHMLRELYEITTKKGRIVTTCRDPAVTSKLEHLEYHKFNKDRGRPIGQLTLRIEYKGECGDWFDLLIGSPQEMNEIGRAAGWEVMKLYKGEEEDYAAVLSKLSQYRRD